MWFQYTTHWCVFDITFSPSARARSDESCQDGSESGAVLIEQRDSQCDQGQTSIWAMHIHHAASRQRSRHLTRTKDGDKSRVRHNRQGGVRRGKPHSKCNIETPVSQSTRDKVRKEDLPSTQQGASSRKRSCPRDCTWDGDNEQHGSSHATVFLSG